jgi:dolichol-phosphate mannosyltransferase
MKTLVIIPTYQEADNITNVLDRVLTAAPTVDVLVVDDDSPDGTGELIAAHRQFCERVFLLRGRPKAGLGVAYRAGYAEALDTGYEAVIQMDADLSHSPEDLPVLLAALKQADVVIGSRYVPGGRTEGWAVSRRLISWAGNLYVRTVLGLPVHDATAGFRAFRTTALTAIDVLHSQSDGYAFQIETTWRAHRRGLKILEVPITFTERIAGASKMSTAIALEAVVNVLFWRLRSLRQPVESAVASRITAPRPRDHAA